MESLNWEDTEAVDIARQFFDKYISAWNPRAPSTLNQPNAWPDPKDPCLLSTQQIFSTNPSSDYEQLVNCVERHTKCSESTCLRKKGSSLQCRYKAPWELHPKSALFIDSSGQKTYTPARNDDRLNSHNPTILSIWRANVDCQPVLSIHAVQKYIAKYASKAEKKSESFHQMLRRIVLASPTADPATSTFRKFLAETLVDRDIGAQETCHMLQKLPLTLCI